MRFPLLSFAALLLTPTIHPASYEVMPLRAPFGRSNPLLAPDGKNALWGDAETGQLWLEEIVTHNDRRVLGSTMQTIELAWAPDSRHFAVNDRYASNAEDAYIFDTNTLERVDLRESLGKSEPQITRFWEAQRADGSGPLLGGRQADHSYLQILHWLNNDNVELELNGHTASRRLHDRVYYSECFAFRYRFGLDGSIQPLSHKVVQPHSNKSLEAEIAEATGSGC